jgi:hypothetical protein
MKQTGTRFQRAIEAIDAANAADPNHETFGGKAWPKELLYGQRMSHWLERVAPNASEALRLAARAQHIERWTSPRKAYPEGRAGYLKWRTDLSMYHAQRTGEILREAGYDEAMIERVATLLQKRGIKTDADVQALEDTACLVFLEHYFADFARTQDEAKMIEIVAKTWRKMSTRGRELALTIPMREEDRRLVESALAL